MPSAVQLLRSSCLPEFQAAGRNCPETFVAIAKTGKGPKFDTEFLREFFRLADRTLSPDTFQSRKGYNGPERRGMFVAAHHEEWLLWEPQPGGIFGFMETAAAAWNLLPNGLKDYRPIHSLGDDWRPWQPEPAWQWLYFVFRQLRQVGSVVRWQRIGEVELLHFTVGVFRACTLAIELMESKEATPTFDAGPWDDKALEDEERLVRRLLRFMKHVEEAPLDKVCEHVWEVTDALVVTENAFKSVRRKANQFLRRQPGCKHFLTKPRDESILRWE